MSSSFPKILLCASLATLGACAADGAGAGDDTATFLDDAEGKNDSVATHALHVSLRSTTDMGTPPAEVQAHRHFSVEDSVDVTGHDDDNVYQATDAYVMTLPAGRGFGALIEDQFFTMEIREAGSSGPWKLYELPTSSTTKARFFEEVKVEPDGYVYLKWAVPGTRHCFFGHGPQYVADVPAPAARTVLLDGAREVRITPVVISDFCDWTDKEYPYQLIVDNPGDPAFSPEH